MSEENLSDAQKKKIAEETEKFRKENEKQVEIKITNDTSLQQERVWDDMKNTIVKEYESRNLKIDPKTIQTKEDMEAHFEALRKMKSDEEKIEALSKNQRDDIGEKALAGNITSGQDFKKPTGDRDVAYLKKLANSLGDLSLVEFNSETEMLRFLENASNDSNFPEQAQAQKLYAKVLSHTLERDSSYEYEGLGKDFGKKKGEWKEKRKGD